MGFLGQKRTSLDQSTGIPEKACEGICIQGWDFSVNKLLYVEIRTGTTGEGPALL